MNQEKKFNIGKVEFTEGASVVIAEAGVNHLGDLGHARLLIEAAKRAGAKIIKFQTYKANRLTTKNAPRFWDWQGEIDHQGTQYDSYSKLDSFGASETAELKRICEEVGIEFMSTPFDLDAVDMLYDLGVGGFKVASCDVTNHPLLERIGQKSLPVLLSTGASDIAEIRDAIRVLKTAGSGPILVMHCNLTYPTKPEDANLRALNALSEEFPDHLLGYSDHTLGVTIAASSVLFGAVAIEKHFTYDKSLPLSADHWLSADEKELAHLVASSEELARARGIPAKIVQESEILARTNARRSCVAARPLKAGYILTAQDVDFKRPGTGVPPSDLHKLIGRALLTNLEYDDLILSEMLASN